MSEADFPNRPEGQTYSPISKYGQISIAEQLAGGDPHRRTTSNLSRPAGFARVPMGTDPRRI